MPSRATAWTSTAVSTTTDLGAPVGIAVLAGQCRSACCTVSAPAAAPLGSAASRRGWSESYDCRSSCPPRFTGAAPSRIPVNRPTDIGALLRELIPQVVGTLVRRYGRFEECEDAAQDALLDAIVQWRKDGVPDNPLGWLTRVAYRRIADRARSDIARRLPGGGGGGHGPGGRARGVRSGRSPPVGPGRFAGPVVPLLSSEYVPVVPAGADAAGVRWSDDEPDSAGVPGAGGDDGAADQPGEAAHQGGGREVRAAAARGPAGAARCGPARAVSDFQRGIHQYVRCGSSPGRADP